jgi:hypothetical protein
MKNQIGISQELIDFQIDLRCQYQSQAPKISVYLDENCMASQEITQPFTTIKFNQLLDFNNHYDLKIHRQGKTDQDPTQMLIIDQILIDGINVQNLIWAHSYYEPEYPQLWYQQQTEIGQIPEAKISGETWLGHNGVWSMPFSSPFWRHLMEVMN